jgi:hypothetical protein
VTPLRQRIQTAAIFRSYSDARYRVWAYSSPAWCAFASSGFWPIGSANKSCNYAALCWPHLRLLLIRTECTTLTNQHLVRSANLATCGCSRFSPRNRFRFLIPHEAQTRSVYRRTACSRFGSCSKCALARTPRLISVRFAVPVHSLWAKQTSVSGLAHCFERAHSGQRLDSKPIGLDPAQFNEFYRKCSRRPICTTESSRTRALPIECSSLSEASGNEAMRSRSVDPRIALSRQGDRPNIRLPRHMPESSQGAGGIGRTG